MDKITMDKITWLYLLVLVLASSLVYVGFRIGGLNKTIEAKELENKILNDQLEKQQSITDSLQRKTDSLLVIWKSKTKDYMINEIKSKNRETYLRIINANIDEQISIAAKWLSEEGYD